MHIIFQIAMADKLLDMSWVIITAPNASKEVLGSSILPDLLKTYSRQDLSETYLSRCMDQLSCKLNITSSLISMQSIVHQQENVNQAALVKFLESKVFICI